MTQQIAEVVLGLVMLVVPFALMQRYNINMAGKVVTALVKMFVGLFLLSLLLFMMGKINSVACAVAFIVMTAFFGGVVAVHNARLTVTRLWLPVGAAFLVVSAVAGLLFVLATVWHIESFAQIQMPLLAATALLVWFMSYVNRKALATYYMGLKRHNRLYDYLIGNGASHDDATDYFTRRALQTALTVSLRQLSLITGVTMSVFWTAVSMGGDLMATIPVVFLFICAALCAGVSSVFVTIWMATKFSFDKYGKLRNLTATPRDDASIVDSPS